MRLFPHVLAGLAIAAAPPPLPVAERDRAAIVAEAASMRPETLAFDRASTAVRHGGGTTSTTARIERWNGKSWSLVSLSGKPPTRDERDQHRRATKTQPVPGYHRLAPIIAAATDTGTDAEGRTIWRIPVLPAGSVFTDSGDISTHLQAEARLARRGDRLWIDRLRITERETFKMNMLIKVTGFAQTLEYQIGPGETPRLMRETSLSSGTMFGFPGGEKGEVTFTYR